MSSDKGASLIEVMVAVVVMTSAAVMYASGWNMHRGQTDAAREIEIATELYLRQVENIKRMDPKVRARAPFNEAAFQDGAGRACPPPYLSTPVGSYANSGCTYYRTVGTGPTNQLHPAQPFLGVLSDGLNGRPPANAFLITPANDVAADPWLIPIPPGIGNPVAAGGMGFTMSVCCARIHNLTGVASPTLAQLNGNGSRAHQIIKYAVRVDRDNGDGNVRNILTHEFLMEVR